MQYQPGDRVQLIHNIESQMEAPNEHYMIVYVPKGAVGTVVPRATESPAFPEWVDVNFDEYGWRTVYHYNHLKPLDADTPNESHIIHEGDTVVFTGDFGEGEVTRVLTVCEDFSVDAPPGRYVLTLDLSTGHEAYVPAYELNRARYVGNPS